MRVVGLVRFSGVWSQVAHSANSSCECFVGLIWVVFCSTWFAPAYVVKVGLICDVSSPEWLFLFLFVCDMTLGFGGYDFIWLGRIGRPSRISRRGYCRNTYVEIELHLSMPTCLDSLWDLIACVIWDLFLSESHLPIVWCCPRMSQHVFWWWQNCPGRTTWLPETKFS